MYSVLSHLNGSISIYGERRYFSAIMKILYYTQKLQIKNKKIKKGQKKQLEIIALSTRGNS